jgi:aminoglycoside/choline kinase family phosphotransferase
MDSRQQALETWLTEICQLPDYHLQPMAGDASFRRYFRVTTSENSYVAMDAPQDNCLPFVAIADALRALGLVTPKIFAHDLRNGFLLLTDFGNDLYLKTLNSTNAEELYGRALDALSIMQTCRSVPGWSLSSFSADFMRRELDWFKEWFLQKHLQIKLDPQVEAQLNHCFDFLAQSAASQPQVFMHRDYHSANLMVLPDNQVSILDFQDAFIGPVTYDLVSLLRDCYISWPEKLVIHWVTQYWEKLFLPNVTLDEFIRWFDLMGLQRHLKALMTFSRKWRRDNDKNYLQHIPRTLNYIVQVSDRHSECRILNEFITDQVMICVE